MSAPDHPQHEMTVVEKTSGYAADPEAGGSQMMQCMLPQAVFAPYRPSVAPDELPGVVPFAIAEPELPWTVEASPPSARPVPGAAAGGPFSWGSGFGMGSPAGIAASAPNGWRLPDSGPAYIDKRVCMTVGAAFEAEHVSSGPRGDPARSMMPERVCLGGSGSSGSSGSTSVQLGLGTLSGSSTDQGGAGGSYPSVGSAGHAARTCRPCAFARSHSGCKFGASCNFCHIVDEHPQTIRMRPCKGKRERFKRTMTLIEAKIAKEPDLFTNGGLSLPAFVDRNPQARARVMAHLAKVATDSYRDVAGEDGEDAEDAEDMGEDAESAGEQEAAEDAEPGP